jgi:hypothetical protein
MRNFFAGFIQYFLDTWATCRNANYREIGYNVARALSTTVTFIFTLVVCVIIIKCGVDFVMVLPHPGPLSGVFSGPV